MAIMIPADGGHFDKRSGEKEMFDALSLLPDGYYVFHSYRVVRLVQDKGLSENEIDFLVFHPNYGCLFIECKNAKLDRDSQGEWWYLTKENGVDKRIHMHDPFDQAFSGQHSLFEKIRDSYPEYQSKINDMKFMVAVWFPKYTRSEIERANFAQNIEKELIMTREALFDPSVTLDQIQALMERMNRVHIVCKYEEEKIIENGKGYQHRLSKEDSMDILRKVLCPVFKTIVNTKQDFEDTYIELLEEQYVVLDFLSHQRTAAINGSGGTGKTLVAVERARRLSEEGQKVLFLCYNRNLMEYLKQVNQKNLPNVDFYTLAAYGCYKCSKPLEHLSYYDLKEIIEQEMVDGQFAYKHIIVDEGQDFGKREDSDSDIKSEILQTFSDYGSGLYENDDTSFFVFYDKNQMANRQKIPPRYLSEVDSKLTLYKNCRNTKKVATTAFSLMNMNPILSENAWVGEDSVVIFYSGQDELVRRLDKTIESYISESESNRVIISCAESIDQSSLNSMFIRNEDGRNYTYKSNGRKTRAFSFSTFKGLEADDVIIVDVGNNTFDIGNDDFYVAASRAKKRLCVFIDKDKVDIENILDSRFDGRIPGMDIYKQLALKMHCIAK